MGDWPLPILTARLELRALTVDDAESHRRLFTDPGLVRHLSNDPLDGDELRAHLERRYWRGPPHDDEWANFAVRDRRDGRFLGEVGVVQRSARSRRYEVGYIFGHDASGHGYATEATAMMVELACGSLDAHRVEAHLDSRNDRSARVAERLGMRREAHLRQNEWLKGEWTDELVYGLLASEWRPRAEWELPRVSLST